MIQFVTLAEASLHLRRDTVDDNADLTLKIQAASAAVKNYLKSASPWEPEIDTFGDVVLDSQGDPVLVEDSAGDPVPRPEVKQAVLYLLGIFYRDRDGQEMEKWQHGFLPFPVTSILYPLRTPTLA